MPLDSLPSFIKLSHFLEKILISFLWFFLKLLRKLIAFFSIQLAALSQQAQTSLNVLKRSPHLTTTPDIITTSGKRRRIYNVLKASNLCCLEVVQSTMSWRRLIYVVLKTSNLQHLEDVWFTTSWGRLIYDVLKTSNLCRLEDV